MASPGPRSKNGPVLALLALVVLAGAGAAYLWSEARALRGELDRAELALAAERSDRSGERLAMEQLQGDLARIGELSSELMAGLEEIQALSGVPVADEAAPLDDTEAADPLLDQLGFEGLGEDAAEEEPAAGAIDAELDAPEAGPADPDASAAWPEVETPTYDEILRSEP